jgi:hypothetical protein
MVFHRILDFKPGLHFYAGPFLLDVNNPATVCGRVKIICDWMLKRGNQLIITTLNIRRKIHAGYFITGTPNCKWLPAAHFQACLTTIEEP